MNSIWRFHAGCLILLGSLLLTSCREQPKKIEQPAADAKSTDKKSDDTTASAEVDATTENSGFNFELIDCQAATKIVPRNGIEAEQFTMLETLGNGVATLDFDRDGLMDVFFAGGGLIKEQKLIAQDSTLLRNFGALRLENNSAQAMVPPGKHYSMGVVVGDHDSDGFEDLLVTGYGGVQFMRNQGDGTFLETELSGVDESLWSTGGAWADFDKNGHPDLYVAHYLDWSWEKNLECGVRGVRNVCPPRKFLGLPDELYMNNGDGTFTIAGTDRGLYDGGKGLGVMACDPDQDSDLDIYVGNDTDSNFFYVNDGNGKFTELAADRGVAVGDDGTANGSMGLDICDFDNDQALDIWVTNYQRESFALYRNQKDNYFVHASFITGISRLGATLVGWGTAWADFDFDGDEDVLVVNGHILYNARGGPMLQIPVLMENHDKRMKQVEMHKSSYLGQHHLSRGLAVADLDNDGDLDAAVSNLNEPVALLENKCQRLGNWLCVDLIGTRSPRTPIGATLILTTDSNSYLRQIKSGGSYLSASDRRVFWGVPQEETIEKLTIRWPSGFQQEISDVDANQLLTLIEPNAAIEAPGKKK